MGRFWESDEDKGNGIEFKPDDFKKEISSTVNSKFDELKNEFSPVLEYIKQQREAAEAEQARQAQLELEKNNRQPNEQDFIVDPKNAVAQYMRPFQEQTLRLAAKQARQDALSEKEYYTGAIKEEVDRMIAAQPLERQSDETLLLNVYKIVCFDKQKEINDGTIKSRTSSAVFGSTGTGGHSGNGEDPNNITLSNEEKEQARKFGISEADWITSKKELVYV